MSDALPIGAIVEREGVRLRHLGGGRFEPAGEELTKRFAPDDGDMTAGMVRALHSRGA